MPGRRDFSQRPTPGGRGGGGCFSAALCLCLALLAAQAAHAAGDTSGELCIRDAAGALVAAWPLREGDDFAIRYTHSVALTPVEDHFVIKDGGIRLDRTVYQDFGAGLPSAPEPGQHMSSGGGRIVMSGYDRPLPSFDVRVGRVAGHALLLPEAAGGGEKPLADLAPPGKALTFSFAPQGCAAGAVPQEPFQRQP